MNLLLFLIIIEAAEFPDTDHLLNSQQSASLDEDLNFIGIL